MKRIVRHFALCLLSAVAIIAMAGAALAAGSVIRGDTMKAVEKELSWLVTNPQGEAKDGKFVYIIGGLRCPFTQKLINRLDEVGDGVQIRWVFPESQYSIPGAEYVMTEQLPQAFSDIANGKRQSATEFEAELDNVDGLIIALLDQRVQTGFPTIIYKTDEGLRLTPLLDDLLADMPRLQPMMDNGEAAERLVYEMAQKGNGKSVKAENNSNQYMHAYALPDVNSPNVDALNTGLEPGYYSYAPCFEYSSDYFMCLLSDRKTKFFLKKNI